MKYIDADKLIAEIENTIKAAKKEMKDRDVDSYSDSSYDEKIYARINSTIETCEDIIDTITSLQQEQPNDLYAVLKEGKIECSPIMKEFIDKFLELGNTFNYGFGPNIQQEQPEVQNAKFVFPKYLYARTKDNKTIDMSYAPQDMTAVEYIRNDFVEQEQPEVDLEKALDEYYKNADFGPSEAIEYTIHKDIARHFYELARQKYEK